MEKSSELKSAYEALAVIGAKDVILFIFKALVKDAQEIVLESSPSDPNLSSKLIIARERAFLLKVLSDNIK